MSWMILWTQPRIHLWLSPYWTIEANRFLPRHECIFGQLSTPQFLRLCIAPNFPLQTIYPSVLKCLRKCIYHSSTNMGFCQLPSYSQQIQQLNSSFFSPFIIALPVCDSQRKFIDGSTLSCQPDLYDIGIWSPQVKPHALQGSAYWDDGMPPPNMRLSYRSLKARSQNPGFETGVEEDGRYGGGGSSSGIWLDDASDVWGSLPGAVSRELTFSIVLLPVDDILATTRYEDQENSTR